MEKDNLKNRVAAVLFIDPQKPLVFGTVWSIYPESFDKVWPKLEQLIESERRAGAIEAINLLAEKLEEQNTDKTFWHYDEIGEAIGEIQDKFELKSN